MKKIMLALTLLIVLPCFAQKAVSGTNISFFIPTSGTHYAIVRTFYVKKTSGTLSRFEIDLGNDVNHPLHDKLVLAPDESLLGTKADGKKVPILTDVDLLEFMSSQGWNLVNTQPVAVANREMIQYLFAKSE